METSRAINTRGSEPCFFKLRTILAPPRGSPRADRQSSPPPFCISVTRSLTRGSLCSAAARDASACPGPDLEPTRFSSSHGGSVASCRSPVRTSFYGAITTSSWPQGVPSSWGSGVLPIGTTRTRGWRWRSVPRPPRGSGSPRALAPSTPRNLPQPDSRSRCGRPQFSRIARTSLHHTPSARPVMLISRAGVREVPHGSRGCTTSLRSSQPPSPRAAHVDAGGRDWSTRCRGGPPQL